MGNLSIKDKRKTYYDTFKKLMNENYCYIPQAGEIIKQCNILYPPYWFISNKGYIFSCYNNKIKILKPLYDKGGKQRKENVWRYSTRYNKDLEKLDRYDMGKLIVEHFLVDNFKDLYKNEKREIHHIHSKSKYKSNEAQKCNNSENLQILPQNIHKIATYFSRTTPEQLTTTWKSTADKTITLDMEQFKSLLANASYSQPVVFFTNNDNNDIEIYPCELKIN